MARLFPLRSETPATEGPPRVVDLDGEDADAVFGALSSNTARRIYAQLDEEPGTPSDVAEAIDSSIQNVRYHLEKLEGAGLVEVVDTWYSSRGNEMSVYATSDGALIVTGDESRASQLKQAVSRFVGGVGVLAGAALFVQAVAERFGSPVGEDGAPADGDTGAAEDDEATDDAGEASDDEEMDDDGFATTAEDEDEEETETETEAVSDDESSDGDGELISGDESGSGGTESPDGISETVVAAVDGLFSGLSPGGLFFLGGLTVLALVGAWWYWTSYRPMAA